MSIRTLVHLCRPEFIQDMFVIARCCLEYKAALKAVLSEPAIAKQYLDFEKRALVSYKKYLESKDQTEKAAEVCEMLQKMEVEDPSASKSKGWCKGGYGKLIKEYGESAESTMYELLCDFAHGSIVSLRFLQKQPPSASTGLKMYEIMCCGYVAQVKEFLEMACITSENQRCEKAFSQVAACLC